MLLFSTSFATLLPDSVVKADDGTQTHPTLSNKSPRVDIKVDGDTLTIDIENARLDAVVKALGSHFNFKTLIIGDYSASKTISASLKNLPTATAVEKILAKANTVVVYNNSDSGEQHRKISQLWLLEAGDGFDIADHDEGKVDENLSFDLEPDLSSVDTRTRSLAVLRLTRQLDSATSDNNSFETALAGLVDALLYDKDALVRTRAAVALGNAQDERAVAALESSLSDQHFSVRRQAIHALGNIGGDAVIDILGEILAAEGIIHDTERAIAAQALWKQNRFSARYYLKQRAKDRSEQVRRLSSNAPETVKRRSHQNTPNTQNAPDQTE